MLPLLPIVTIGQIFTPVDPLIPTPIPIPAQQLVIKQPQEVRALPGQLDKVLMFNSNSPEVIQTEGILLSTFPPTGKAAFAAHLNLPLQGNFNLFTHHIARASTPEEKRTLYQGIIVYNPGDRPVTLDILQAVSYVTNPDAPFIDLPPTVDNAAGNVFSGPGSRVTNGILRGFHQADFPSQLVIPPKQSQMLFNLPIAQANCRSTFMRLRSKEPVYMASLAMYARQNPDLDYDLTNPLFLLFPPPVTYRPPLLEEWQQLLETGNLAQPRDRFPTPLEKDNGYIIYSRVAGVAQGSEWHTDIVDRPGKQELSIPKRGQAFSYPLSTVNMITLGTSQVQSAPLLVRYPDTAYRAHGNYGVRYNLTLPLYNNSSETQTVTLAIQTPVKEENREDGLRFLEPPDQQIFFRGTVQISYKDDAGIPKTAYVHLVQRRGQKGQPLVMLNMPKGDRRLVKVEFIYPPDATPPQVLTVSTVEASQEQQSATKEQDKNQ